MIFDRPRIQYGELSGRTMVLGTGIGPASYTMYTCSYVDLLTVRRSLLGTVSVRGSTVPRRNFIHVRKDSLLTVSSKYLA